MDGAASTDCDVLSLGKNEFWSRGGFSVVHFHLGDGSLIDPVIGSDLAVQEVCDFLGFVLVEAVWHGPGRRSFIPVFKHVAEHGD